MSNARQFTLHTWWLVGGVSVACPTIYFTNMEAPVSWTSSQGVELMASYKDRLRRRRERDRLKDRRKLREKEKINLCISYYSYRRQCSHKNTSTPTELEGAGLISSRCCYPSWHSVLLPLAHAPYISILNATHRNYTYSPLMAIILSSWSLLA